VFDLDHYASGLGNPFRSTRQNLLGRPLHIDPHGAGGGGVAGKYVVDGIRGHGHRLVLRFWIQSLQNGATAGKLLNRLSLDRRPDVERQLLGSVGKRHMTVLHAKRRVVVLGSVMLDVVRVRLESDDSAITRKLLRTERGARVLRTCFDKELRLSDANESEEQPIQCAHGTLTAGAVP